MKRTAVILCMLVVVVLSCVDESSHLTIPYAPVSFRIELTGPDYLLRTPLSFITLSEKEQRLPTDRLGYAGLLVVSDATANAIYAYDLCCPYEDSKVIKVVPENNGSATCPQCKSVFVTMYGQGSVVSGPASESLQKYTVIPLQQGSYRIIN
jgi:nitrite reductase/ring-hydroxylating ferredoxin subunit